MCRFLMIKSAIPVVPREFLESFAELAERSPAPDGDPQADGWGISWTDASGRWQACKFTEPIWESAARFVEFPGSRSICIHARSASAPELKNDLAFNQPFVDGRYAFVFNGFLEGISLPFPVPGRIGSQKIWELVRSRLAGSGGQDSLSGGPRSPEPPVPARPGPEHRAERRGQALWVMPIRRARRLLPVPGP